MTCTQCDQPFEDEPDPRDDVYDPRDGFLDELDRARDHRLYLQHAFDEEYPA